MGAHKSPQAYLKQKAEEAIHVSDSRIRGVVYKNRNEYHFTPNYISMRKRKADADLLMEVYKSHVGLLNNANR